MMPEDLPPINNSWLNSYIGFHRWDAIKWSDSGYEALKKGYREIVMISTAIDIMRYVRNYNQRETYDLNTGKLLTFSNTRGEGWKQKRIDYESMQMYRSQLNTKERILSFVAPLRPGSVNEILWTDAHKKALSKRRR